jgi:hypothetical protein
MTEILTGQLKKTTERSNINCIMIIAGADPGGAHPGRAPPLKLEKIWFFWRKIVIFHTNYPKNFRASLRSAQFFQVRPPNLKTWIRPCIGMSCLTLCILCRYEDKSMKNNSFSETVEHVKHISVRHVSPVVGLILIFFYV